MLAALHPDRVRSLAALSVGHPNASRPRSLESREKAWYQLLFQFEEAEELLLRDDARLLREWLADAPDAERYVEELREPGALTARPRPLPRQPAPARRAARTARCRRWPRRRSASGARATATSPRRAMVRSGEHVTGPWRYERVDGASHWLQLDAPERVNRLLLEHLRS